MLRIQQKEYTMNEEIKKLIRENPEIAAIYAEHPDIEINTWKNLYVGDREFIYDINNDLHDPIEELEQKLDGTWEEDEDDSYENEIELGNKMFLSLSPEDQYIIRRHVYEGASLAQIGREKGYTRQNAKHHYERIKKLLAKSFTNK